MATQERDAVIDRWLRDEVVAVYDAMRAEPARGISGDEVAVASGAHHVRREAKQRRGV